MSLEKFTKERFLLCEGDADKGFFEALIRGRQLPEFQVCHTAECNNEEVGGSPGFVKSLKGMEPIKGFPELKALLLVSDNDVLGTSFKVVQDALTHNSYTPPTAHNSIGRMAGKPVVIFMLPNYNLVGDLETLCLPAIHTKWPNAERCVNSFLECSGANLWTKRASVSKARARSATVGFHQDDPYKGIGHLFRNGTLSVDHPCFDEIAQFLQMFDAMCDI
jgi:hypothetical protein